MYLKEMLLPLYQYVQFTEGKNPNVLQKIHNKQVDWCVMLIYGKSVGI